MDDNTLETIHLIDVLRTEIGYAKNDDYSDVAFYGDWLLTRVRGYLMYGKEYVKVYRTHAETGKILPSLAGKLQYGRQKRYINRQLYNK
jgi:hypothetical protein